jgi:ribosomal-protein-alanine N-acetyltransferase
MKAETYTTRRFIIRPESLKDYKSWFKAYTNLLPKQNKHDTGPYKPSQCKKEHLKKNILRQRKRMREKKTFYWSIFDKNTNEMLGTIDIHILHLGNLQKANLGYEVFNNHWRKGIAQEALKKVIPGVLMDLKLNRLEAVIDLDNLPSRKLVESLKLRKEGVRENYFFQDNDWADQIVYIADRKLYKLPKLIIKK